MVSFGCNGESRWVVELDWLDIGLYAKDLRELGEKFVVRERSFRVEDVGGG